MSEITLASLTTGTVDGTGVFDVMMRAVKAHVQEEFDNNHIRGAEYSSVYLGAIEVTLQTATQFVLNKQKTEQEIENLGASKLNTAAQTNLINQQASNAVSEGLILTAQKSKLEAEYNNLAAQTSLVNQQVSNAISENLILVAQKSKLDVENTKTLNESALIVQEIENLGTTKLSIAAQTSLVTQQSSNAISEGLILVAQKCKLDAEYDNLLANKTKTLNESALIVQNTAKTIQETLLIDGQTAKSSAETSLLAQKVATEKAQILALGVDDNSVVGRQKELYAAQTNGFTRDAEQKAADILIKTWQVRRTTDDATIATDDGANPNYLGDHSIGRVVTKLLSGVGA